MPEWVQWLLVPAITFGASYVGNLAASRTDIAWLKRELSNVRKAVSHAHERIDALLSHKSN